MGQERRDAASSGGVPYGGKLELKGNRMSEFVVQATIKDKLFHKFQPLCWKLKLTQEAVITELIERLVRENKAAKKSVKGRS